MYTAADFYQIENIHPYMMLWLFERREEIRDSLIDEIINDYENVEEATRIREMIRTSKISFEKLQQETGLRSDDLDHFYKLGAAIAEYEKMRSMSDDERAEYIEEEYCFESVDEDSLSDEEKENLNEIKIEIIQAIKEFAETRFNQEDAFKNIVINNFNEEDGL